jgi:creatinine amidohydrolase/Fe(II)-dependent formamide hydrolase-like protein
MIRKINIQSWKQLEQFPKDKVFLMLPVSSLEQHGPHLPVGTDDLILEYILSGLIDNEKVYPDILLLPAIHYGMSPEHMGYTGTFTMSAQTLCAIIEDIIQCMKVHGWKNLILINSHGGNTSLLHAMSQTWKYKYDIDTFHIDFWGAKFFNNASELIDTPVSLEVHGGEIETSILMNILSQTVNTAELKNMKDCNVGLSSIRGSWKAEELSESGAIGGSTYGTSVKGKALIDYMFQNVIQKINSISM